MNRLISRSLIAAVLAGFVVSPAMAEKKNDWTLSFPETKAHFVKVQMEWAKKNPDWKPTKEELEAKFDEFDANKDGKLTEEEWNNRDGGKKPKQKKKN